MKIIRLVLLILHFGILFLLIGVLLNAYIPPKVFPWFNLLSLVFPLLITGYILLTFFWIFSWKKRAFVFMFVGLFFLNPVKRWVNYSTDKKEVANLKIVTFNIKGGKFGLENINRFVNDQNADIVLIQEDADFEYHFNGLKKDFKNPIVGTYSKYKTVAHKELFQGMYSEEFNAFAEYTDIEIKGKTYRIINTYLQPFKFEKSMVKLNGNSQQDEQKVKGIIRRLIPAFKMHQEQIAIIRRSIDESPYPVILTGDLNSVPNSYEYYHLGKGLNDAFFEAGKGSGTSFHDYKYPLRIDFVFVSPSIKPVSYHVDRSVKLSDHFPVIATFRLE
ncbi:endonuclease/exonuclease/phosphatase family protein [Chryseobacterium wangxinyae]|uniref:endonuclease/exonuclease/phosphatase family protein n=1 Tax=Chryseobacterium sp. CY350 TaxID=2997336 RepID=UPI00226F9B48|nr:endonuclease/exonuclease/phosphatase family protein [Chryseobacterium sp. CY350]MCY0976176.1 endonuclease/exonuclease/phosphatase family protein [Chryseobacterium sp. CY350]WBZ94226.1 endonuclease/exonuclease/phosphatase family protein [Chryseobacterium sp. CY350]